MEIDMILDIFNFIHNLILRYNAKSKYEIILHNFNQDKHILLSKEIVFLSRPEKTKEGWETIQLVLNNEYSLFQKINKQIHKQISSFDEELDSSTFTLMARFYNHNHNVIDSWIILRSSIESISHKDDLILLIIKYQDVIFK